MTLGPDGSMHLKNVLRQVDPDHRAYRHLRSPVGLAPTILQQELSGGKNDNHSVYLLQSHRLRSSGCQRIYIWTVRPTNPAGNVAAAASLT